MELRPSKIFIPDAGLTSLVEEGNAHRGSAETKCRIL